MSMTPPPSGIIAWFARNSVAANLLLLSVIVMGVLSLSQLRREAFPSMEPDRVTVSVTYNSGDPKQAEEGVAIKIEEALESVPGIKRITSTSNAGGSTVTIEKTSDYNLNTLLSDIKTKVDGINNFPSDAEKPIIEKDRMQDHAIWVQLYGSVDRATLQSLAQELKTDLLQQPAIRDLEIKASADPVISIDIDEANLQSYNLSLSDVEDKVNAESSTPLMTSLRHRDKAVRLKVANQRYEAEEFAQIPLINTSQGTTLKLGEIAVVRETFDEDTFTLSRYNQQNGMSIEIVMDEYGDVTLIAEQAKSVVQQWRDQQLLPEEIFLETWYDQSQMINDRLSLLVKNAISGIILVFFVLALFLNVRVAFWVAAGLPFVFFGSLFFMTGSFANLTINEMTTFGFIMALGIVVDDAVVVGESIYDTRRNEGDSLDNSIKGAMKVAIPTVFGVLTTVAAFMALSNVTGGLGQIFAQFAAVVTVCLLLSMVESKLILPSHLAHLNTHRNATKGGWSRVQRSADSVLNFLNYQMYTPVIKLCLRFRYATLLLFLSLLIVIATLPMSGTVKMAFFPDIPRDIASADITMLDDASFGQTHRNLLVIEQAAKRADTHLRAQLGLPTEQSSISSLQVLASSDTEGSVTIAFIHSPGYDTNQFTKIWNEQIGLLEGAKRLKVLASMDMVDNFKIELKASDAEQVTAAGKAVKAYLQTIPGISGIDGNLSPGVPQYRFTLTEQGRALGLTTAQLADQVLHSFGGGEVQKFQRKQDEVTVSVRYPEQERQTLADIMNANIRSSDGTVIPLSSVAMIDSDYQASAITRINNQRAVYVSAVVDKAMLSPSQVVNQVKQQFLAQWQKEYPHLRVDFAGEAEQQAETMQSMELMFVAAMIAIYALLAIPLRSYIQPLLIMMAIPFGIVGAILGHWVNGLTLSILSMFGILALSGVVVNDSLLLVSRYNGLQEEGKPILDTIIEACNSRLRAILLTSITTFSGLIPLLSETSMQAQFLKPAAASLGYGIMFATMITLLLIPVLLYIQYEIQKGVVDIVKNVTCKVIGKASC
ncbi:MMPL family transporter [Vibrio sp. V27_P1S3P104]|nr:MULTISPECIES: efflux RND transporter permease subunit [unclassified Vibrio]NAW70479.1 MMPL family transporter [Vibrio sp. V28_P6S34P95]NAX04111.1 MMPL family transporter [Vibrio sp. V30_P3S12P165]NAX34294.1 MMPL family transporter [Vibrio sp. V29_P1S30P107]NAX37551.1 MMPL family transporter [Vibrio sp. V27_P1S3P104]